METICPKMGPKHSPRMLKLTCDLRASLKNVFAKARYLLLRLVPIPPLASKKSCTGDSQSEILFDKSYSVYHQRYRRSSLCLFLTKYAKEKYFGEAIQMLKTFDQFIQLLKEWCLVTLDKMYS